MVHARDSTWAIYAHTIFNSPFSLTHQNSSFAERHESEAAAFWHKWQMARSGSNLKSYSDQCSEKTPAIACACNFALHAGLSCCMQAPPSNKLISNVACNCTAAADVLNEQHPSATPMWPCMALRMTTAQQQNFNAQHLHGEQPPHHDSVLPTAKHLARSKATLRCSEVENSILRGGKIGLRCHHMQYCSTGLGMHARQQARCRQPAQCFVPRLWVPLSIQCACECTSVMAPYTVWHVAGCIEYDDTLKTE